MKSIVYGMVTIFVCLCFVGLPLVHADGLVVKDGSTAVIDGGTLVMNCQTLKVESGGTLTLNSGTIDSCCRIEVETGGTFTQVGGAVYWCSVFLPSVYDLLLFSQ